MLTGQHLTDLHGLGTDEYSWFLGEALEEFPSSRGQCAHLVFQALKDALADHRSYLLEEFTGEKALVCTCFGVSEETVESYIRENSSSNVDEVTESVRAGGGCGSCRMLIQEMIDSHGFENSI